MVEPLAATCHAVGRAGVGSQGWTLILGAGAVGLLIAEVWRALGGRRVSVVDLAQGRLATAASLGTPVWTGSFTEPPVDTMFEATGSPEALVAWLPALPPAGRAVVVGSRNTLSRRIGRT